MRLALPTNRSDFFHQAGCYSIIATCLFIPLSTSLMGLFAALAVLFWFLSGKFCEFPQLLRTHPAILASTVLIVLFLVGMFYSPADWEEIIDNLKKYRELIYIPMVISLMNNRDRNQKKALLAFWVGCTILLLTSYAMTMGLIPSARYGNSLVYHITHNFFMAVLAFGAAHNLCNAKTTVSRLLWFAIAAATGVNILYIAPGRTGMITFLMLILLFIYQRLSWKKGLAATLLLAVVTSGAFYTSPSFSGRMVAAMDEIQHYKPGISRTSMGQRLDWWNDSWQLIKEHPVFGNGTGSFTIKHDELIKKTQIKPTDNPHNEYLFIGVQLGFIGLLAFLGIFIAGWYSSLKLEEKRKWLTQGVILSMAAGCLANSFLFDSHQGHYFAFLSGILLSSSADDVS